MKRLLMTTAALVALFASVGNASADQEADAREAYKNGRTYYKDGKYAEAVLALKRAYELKPHPALLRYMGDAYYKLNKAREAIDHYKLYLKEAPQAADRAKVESKVRQLEMVIGASDDDVAPAPAPAPEPTPAPTPAPSPAATPPGGQIEMTPTGEDQEVPLALRQKRLREQQQGQRERPRDGGTSALTILKWAALGLGVGGIALGGTFLGLASKKAGELEDSVQASGNLDGKSPKVPFSEEHFNLQQTYKRNRTIGIVGMAAGGVALGTSIILFVVDRKPEQRRRADDGPRVGVAPVIGGGLYGLSGEVSF